MNIYIRGIFTVSGCYEGVQSHQESTSSTPSVESTTLSTNDYNSKNGMDPKVMYVSSYN